MHFYVTGAAGFVGSNLADRLLSLGHRVTGHDNLSTGRPEFIQQALAHPSYRLVEGDLLNLEELTDQMNDVDFVFHMAANADVRFGTEHPRKDLEQNTLVTSNVLEAMRRRGVRRIAFASTGSVYGEPDIFPTPENAPFPIQTSLYAASKLAAEGLLEAYAEGFNMEVFIFRFVSLLGERYSHGHVLDFYQQLREHPQLLKVLGNGRQRKSYLYVQDCIDAMLIALDRPTGKVNLYNLGQDEYCEVNDSIGWICAALGVKPELQYSGGERGWTGDSPFIFLDCRRIRSLGWTPRLGIRDAVIRTVEFLKGNDWLTRSK
jgi:UDP-glucose 4-epimerase